MPSFEPFVGVRYDPEVVELAQVIAPPYDVIDDERRVELEARSPYNAVRIELPRGDSDSESFAAASGAFQRWKAQGILVRDEEPALYAYRIGYRDELGRLRQTAGVIGALELTPLGTGEVLPHERTMPKPKDERLGILRSCRANVSPVWMLSLASGLSALCELPGPPIARATDDEGVHHRLWRITQPAVMEAVAAVVNSAPLIIADGHHRYETALAYQRERRAATGGEPGDYDRIMAFVVELSEDQLSVRPIHRLLSRLPDGFDLVRALSKYFELFEISAPVENLPARMVDARALALVVPDGAWLLRPRLQAFGPDLSGATDSALLEVAVSSLPAHDLTYQHNPEQVAALVGKGEAQAAVLLRAPSVAQIAAAARAGQRMPEKTTFFYPKPRTGLVFREV